MATIWNMPNAVNKELPKKVKVLGQVKILEHANLNPGDYVVWTLDSENGGMSSHGYLTKHKVYKLNEHFQVKCDKGCWCSWNMTFFQKVLMPCERVSGKEAKKAEPLRTYDDLQSFMGV